MFKHVKYRIFYENKKITFEIVDMLGNKHETTRVERFAYKSPMQNKWVFINNTFFNFIKEGVYNGLFQIARDFAVSVNSIKQVKSEEIISESFEEFTYILFKPFPKCEEGINYEEIKD